MEQKIPPESVVPPAMPAAEQVPEAAAVVAAAPEQAQPLETVPLAAASSAEKIYRHDHGGGRQFEGTLAEARKVCPVLGRMSVQEASNTLAQADLAERLAAKGREKRLAEEAAVQGSKESDATAAKPVKSLLEKPVKHEAPEPVAAKAAERSAAHESLAATALADAVQQQASRANTQPPAQKLHTGEDASRPTAPIEAVVGPAPPLTRPDALPVVEAGRVPLAVRQGHEAIIQAQRLSGETLPEYARPIQALDISSEAAIAHPVDAGAVAGLAAEVLAEPGLAARAVDEAVAHAINAPVDHELPASTLEGEFSPAAQGTTAVSESSIVGSIEPSLDRPFAIGRTSELAEASPESICEDFAEALQVVVVPSAKSSAPAREKPTTAVAQESAESPDDAPIPAIAVTVSARLAELTPQKQELAAPMLAEIAGMLHKARPAEAQENEAPIPLPEVDKVRLEALVAELLETLEIKFEEEDVQDLLLVLLRPDFRPSTAVDVADADLEHMGTHEIKRRFAQLANSLADVEERMHQLLGGFVLFYASHDRQYELIARP